MHACALSWRLQLSLASLAEYGMTIILERLCIIPTEAICQGDEPYMQQHWLIAEALSKLTACSDEPKELWIDDALAVLWANGITLRSITGYSPLCLVIGQDAVLPIELKNLTCNTANWTPGIGDTASLLAARATQLERRREDINAAIHHLTESRDANKCYVDQAANLRAEDLEIGDLVLVHEFQMEQSPCCKLDHRWRGPDPVTEISQSLGTYWLADLD